MKEVTLNIPWFESGMPKRSEDGRHFYAGQHVEGMRKYWREYIVEDLNVWVEGVGYEIEPGLAVDCYSEEYKIAFDFNILGDQAWPMKPTSYHKMKYDRCKELGIRLITFWEDQLMLTPSICKSMIADRLGVSKNKIGARKCEIRPVKLKERRKFFDENHIQGNSPCSDAYGLYYNDELVSCMTFGKRKGLTNLKGDEEWELIRFANKRQTAVQGGASKLFKHFVKEHDPKKVVSFSSRDISDGNMYDLLGFEKAPKATSSYWYVDLTNLDRYHRAAFTRNNVAKKFGLDKNDKSWTEREAMILSQYIRIDDCGQLKWTWKKK